MRRTFGDQQPYPGQHYGQSHVEEENDRAENELAEKTKLLKTLTIDIGDEVRYQNKMLAGMDDDFDRSGGLLSSSMKRLLGIASSGGNWHMCYLILFCLFVFFVLWLVLKFR